MKEKPPIHISKRIFDIIASTSVLLVLSPLFVVFLLLIFIEHVLRGHPFAPLFYSETRWSAGKPFMLYKYNIFKPEVVEAMRTRNEFIHTKNLERGGHLIYVGMFLKQIYLDETPQFFNVIKGDMSIVGPRPMNTEVHERLKEQGFTIKDKMKAGITGYYQAVHKTDRNRGSQERLDTYYVDYYLNNPWYKLLFFDIKILCATVLVLIMARGI